MVIMCVLRQKVRSWDARQQVEVDVGHDMYAISVVADAEPQRGPLNLIRLIFCSEVECPNPVKIFETCLYQTIRGCASSRMAGKGAC